VGLVQKSLLGAPPSDYLGRNGKFTFHCKPFAHLVLAVRTLRRGKHRLLLWSDIEADGSVDTTTPSKMETQDEMGRLEKVS